MISIPPQAPTTSSQCPPQTLSPQARAGPQHVDERGLGGEALALPVLNPDSCTLHWTRPRMRLSLRKAARSAPEPPSCTGNPGKRVMGVETLSQSAKALFP